jgi:signal transduction histidine kinase
LKRLQSIGALLTALTGAMMVTIIVVCAVVASNAFLRTQQAAETLAVVVLKRGTLLPKTNLRGELGLERSVLLSPEKASPENLRQLIALHAATEHALAVWAAQMKTHQHADDGVVLDRTLHNRAGYAKLWPDVLAAAQKPKDARPPELANQWTVAVDNLTKEIDSQSQMLSRTLDGADAFIREMLRINDLAWTIRADAGVDRRILASGLIEQDKRPLDTAKLDQMTGKIDTRWDIITNEAAFPVVPPEMKKAIGEAARAFFQQFRPARNMIAAKLAKGQAPPEWRGALMKNSDPSFDDLSKISSLALSLTEAHAATAKKSETRTLTAAITVIILSIALGFLLAAYIMRRIVRPLTQITQIMKNVAEGDWRQKIPFKERKDEIGQFSRTLQSFRDNVAEKQRLEIDLVRNMSARESAETSSRLKSEFLANMSHELRTPLNAILGFSEIIQSEVLGPGVPKYREYANDINGAGHHLLSLINDILDLSKAEAGKLELRPEPVVLEELIEECIRLVRGRATEQGLRVVKAAKPMPAMEIDRLRMKQVLLNLMSNAVKFTQSGGSVTVEAEQIASGDVMVRVRDTGIGIPTDQIATVFEPFHQIDSKLSRKFEGTGLGLSLVRTFVELHGGTVRLESEVDKGTTVSICLPAARCIEAAKARPHAAASRGAKSLQA